MRGDICGFKQIVLFLLLALLICKIADAQDHPNIILIYTDDQGYGDVSALNPGSKFRTKHIDRIASEGIVFSDGHCSATSCSPSRYGLLTGRYSWRTSLKRGVLQADGECLIKEGRTTLATLCKRAGYGTAMVGKWHLRMQYPGTKGDRDWSQPVTDGPNDKGFDYFFGLAASMNFGILTYTENDHVTELPSMWTDKKHDNDPYTDFRFAPPYDEKPLNERYVEVAPSFRDDLVLETLTSKAVQYINERSGEAREGKPFFLYFAPTAPHLPHSVHPSFKGSSSIGKYGDFMMEIDHRVGQILTCLEENGLDENTMIIFSSDNGAERNYRYYRDVMGHHCSYHFRGGKRDIYEGGHRVPFLIRWPEGIRPGTTDQLVCQTDLLATFAEMFHINLSDNEGEDSFSFLPVLKDPRSGRSGRQAIVHKNSKGYLAYREGPWKLFLGKNDKGENSFELYKLDDDIREEHNLYGQYPQLQEKLRNSLADAIVNGRSSPGEVQSNDTENLWDQLFWLENLNIP